MKIIELNNTDAKYKDSFFVSVEIINENGNNIGYSSFIMFINYEKKIINIGNIYKIGFDLSKIVLNNYTNEEFNKILTTSLKNSQEMDCGCVKNEYEINSCYIEYIAEMISDFKLYRERNSSIVNKILAKKNIIKFYTNYFFILNKSANYKNITFENLYKKFGFLLDEVLHYSLPNKVQ